MLRAEALLQLLDSAFRVMGEREGDRGPLALLTTMHAVATLDKTPFAEEDVPQVWGRLISQDPNEAARLLYGRYLRRWDTFSASGWCGATMPFTIERRRLEYDLLQLPEQVRARTDELFPIASVVSQPIVIARSHEEWYTPARRSVRTFYWNAYQEYLRKVEHWNDEGIQGIDGASTSIVERLSDPERPEIYATKGLVVGYVQSGKTANFTAVLAKAADAGYRLLIVLAGTLNILREQTQRRIDKDLIGKEIIEAEGNHEYESDGDWDKFISHGDQPSRLGVFDWERLTGSREEYQSLERGFRALELPKAKKDRRFNDPVNLHAAPARLVVIKKTPGVLNRLNKALQHFQSALEEVPVLVIDDESDQASINTRKPTPEEKKTRTATNSEIIRLLKLLPRSQYIGYTATPYANVFVDPLDAEDLFPRDYIVALPKPHGYMGVADFFDLAADGGDLADDEKPVGFTSKEEAFIRDVTKDDSDEANLPRAIDSFVLSGALKLFRVRHGLNVKIQHHTMLVHRSVKKTDHEVDADLVAKLYDKGGYGKGAAYNRLWDLYQTDFSLVTDAQSPEAPQPQSLEELRPFIDQCISRIQTEPVRIVNGDTKWAEKLPNFDRDSVWSILVGGTKLSRGYTVEGLTVSYYRRRIKTADTLMQAGRWFGFRGGYRDLVRLFLGRNEQDSGGKTIDLYEAFKSVFRDEEAFRGELRRYVQGGQTKITPRDIPPLVRSHLLQPAAKNKMYNAIIRFQNFGGQWKERVLPPEKPKDLEFNAVLLRQMLATLPKPRSHTFRIADPDNTGMMINWSGFTYEMPSATAEGFLKSYRWFEGKPLLQRELEFLRGTGGSDAGIRRWLLIAPQRTTASLTWGSPISFKVMERSRTGNLATGSFKAFSERRHRIVAEYLAGVREDTAETASSDMRTLRKPQTAVFVLYPVVDKARSDALTRKAGIVPDDKIVLGFGLQFPKNNIRTSIAFGVRDPFHSENIVIDADDEGDTAKISTSATERIARISAFVANQFGSDPMWTNINNAIWNRINSNSDLVLRASGLRVIAEDAGTSVDNVMRVLGLLSDNVSGPLQIEYVRGNSVDGSRITRNEVAGKLADWWRNKTISDKEWEAWAGDVLVYWRTRRGEQSND